MVGEALDSLSFYFFLEKCLWFELYKCLFVKFKGAVIVCYNQYQGDALSDLS